MNLLVTMLLPAAFLPAFSPWRSLQTFWERPSVPVAVELPANGEVPVELRTSSSSAPFTLRFRMVAGTLESIGTSFIEEKTSLPSAPTDEGARLFDAHATTSERLAVLDPSQPVMSRTTIAGLVLRRAAHPSMPSSLMALRLQECLEGAGIHARLVVGRSPGLGSHWFVEVADGGAWIVYDPLLAASARIDDKPADAAAVREAILAGRLAAVMFHQPKTVGQHFLASGLDLPPVLFLRQFRVIDPQNGISTGRRLLVAAPGGTIQIDVDGLYAEISGVDVEFHSASTSFVPPELPTVWSLSPNALSYTPLAEPTNADLHTNISTTPKGVYLITGSYRAAFGKARILLNGDLVSEAEPSETWTRFAQLVPGTSSRPISFELTAEPGAHAEARDLSAHRIPTLVCHDNGAEMRCQAL